MVLGGWCYCAEYQHGCDVVVSMRQQEANMKLDEEQERSPATSMEASGIVANLNTNWSGTEMKIVRKATEKKKTTTKRPS